jgi:hypothetical protein
MTATVNRRNCAATVPQPRPMQAVSQEGDLVGWLQFDGEWVAVVADPSPNVVRDRLRQIGDARGVPLGRRWCLSHDEHPGNRGAYHKPLTPRDERPVIGGRSVFVRN